VGGQLFPQGGPGLGGVCVGNKIVWCSFGVSFCGFWGVSGWGALVENVWFFFWGQVWVWLFQKRVGLDLAMRGGLDQVVWWEQNSSTWGGGRACWKLAAFVGVVDWKLGGF